VPVEHFALPVYFRDAAEVDAEVYLQDFGSSYVHCPESNELLLPNAPLISNGNNSYIAG
jgi:hypothetical protein